MNNFPKQGNLKKEWLHGQRANEWETQEQKEGLVRGSMLRSQAVFSKELTVAEPFPCIRHYARCLAYHFI